MVNVQDLALRRQADDFVPSVRLENADVACSIRVRITLQACLEDHPDVQGKDAALGNFPFLGDAQVGQGQAGDGLVAQGQEVLVEHPQGAGDPDGVM
jgi:hypothetical protein